MEYTHEKYNFRSVKAIFKHKYILYNIDQHLSKFHLCATAVKLFSLNCLKDSLR